MLSYANHVLLTIVEPFQGKQLSIVSQNVKLLLLGFWFGVLSTNININ